MHSNSRVNIVVVSDTEENSKDLAERICITKINEADIWHEHREGVDINTYVRWPNCIITAAPIGITDILLAYISKPNEDSWNYIKSYIDERKSIPYKYIISSSDLSKEANELGLDFIKLEELKERGKKDELIKAAINEERTLRDVFNRLDLDKDGAINELEILSVSKALNHPLNDEDAKEIIKLLSNQGKIFYDKFKQWWVMGRTDFNSFRRLVQLELFFSALAFTKKKIDNYFKPIINEAKNTFTEDTRMGMINIQPDCDGFDSKTSIGCHFTLGKDFDDISKTLPSYYTNSTVNLGIELYLRNDNDGPKVLEIINALKDDLYKNNELIQWLIDNVIKINIRHVGNSIYLDISPKAGIDDQTQSQLSTWDLFSMAYAGNLDCHISSKLSAFDLHNSGAEIIIKQLSHIKLEAKAEYPSQKNIVDYLIYSSLDSISNEYIKFILKFIGSTKTYNLNFQYEPKTLQQMILDAIGNLMNKENIEFNQVQEIWKNFKSSFSDTAKKTVNIFSKPFKNHKELIYYLYMNNFSVYFSSQVLKCFIKLNFLVDGLDDLIIHDLK